MYVLASCVVVLIFYIECVSYVYVCVCCGSSYPTRRQNPPKKQHIRERTKREQKRSKDEKSTSWPSTPSPRLSTLLVLVGADVDTRVGLRVVGGSYGVLSDTLGILVEQDITSVLDESTLPVVVPNRDQKVLIRVMVVLSNKVLDGLGSLPSVVMRDLAGNVMSDVGLANSVKDVLSDRSKELSVKRAKSTLGKGPLFGRVVGQKRVGVLSKRNSDQPMVDLQVRQDVENKDLLESTLRHPVSNDGEDDSETEVGDQDLGSVFRLEDDGRGGEVVGEPRVPLLSTSVPDQISRPSEQLLNDQVVEDDNRSITDSFLEFFLSLLRDGSSIQLSFLLDSRRTDLAPRLGNKHFIPGHMPRSRMMPSMTDPPRMIRNE